MHYFSVYCLLINSLHLQPQNSARNTTIDIIAELADDLEPLPGGEIAVVGDGCDCLSTSQRIR